MRPRPLHSSASSAHLERGSAGHTDALWDGLSQTGPPDRTRRSSSGFFMIHDLHHTNIFTGASTFRVAGWEGHRSSGDLHTSRPEVLWGTCEITVSGQMLGPGWSLLKVSLWRTLDEVLGSLLEDKQTIYSWDLHNNLSLLDQRGCGFNSWTSSWSLSGSQLLVDLHQPSWLLHVCVKTFIPQPCLHSRPQLTEDKRPITDSCYSCLMTSWCGFSRPH